MKKILLIIVFACLYVATSELNAKRKAEEFCNETPAGDSTQGIIERGLHAGASKQESSIEDNGVNKFIYIGFTGYAPGSSFLCRLTDKNGLVAEKRIHSRSLQIFR